MEKYKTIHENKVLINPKEEIKYTEDEMFKLNEEYLDCVLSEKTHSDYKNYSFKQWFYAFKKHR